MQKHNNVQLKQTSFYLPPKQLRPLTTKAFLSKTNRNSVHPMSFRYRFCPPYGQSCALL
jgi:hypothetical protein